MSFRNPHRLLPALSLLTLVAGASAIAQQNGIAPGSQSPYTAPAASNNPWNQAGRYPLNTTPQTNPYSQYPPAPNTNAASLWSNAANQGAPPAGQAQYRPVSTPAVQSAFPASSTPRYQLPQQQGPLTVAPATPGGFQPAPQPGSQPGPQPGFQPAVPQPGFQPAQPGFQSGPQPAPNFTPPIGPGGTAGQQQVILPELRPQINADAMEATKILAVVGKETILAGDLLGTINQMLEPYKDKATEEQLVEQRKLLLQRLLKTAVETKMLYADFIREIPADKIPEVHKQLFQLYDEKELPNRIAEAGVTSPAELDAKLREFGSSMDKQRRAFMERVLAQQHLRQHVNYDVEVTHLEMLDFYQEHQAEYEIPARAKWERLMVRLDRYDGNKGAAYRDLAQLGNRVLQGASLAEVARQSSHGFRASEGGQHDWTNRGSLRSDVIDTAIFTLPIGRLSQIIEDDEGFHIIRVLEREEQTKVEFVKAQVEIKEKIRKEKVRKQIEEYVGTLKERTTVWTVFDNAAATDPTASPSNS